MSDDDVGGVPQVTGYQSSLISRDSCWCEEDVSAREPFDSTAILI